MGLTEGGVRGQILGAQIGFMSNVLEHSAWTLPFTHAHRHAENAKLAAEKKRRKDPDNIAVSTVRFCIVTLLGENFLKTYNRSLNITHY